jgi:hypothetical protein
MELACPELVEEVEAEAGNAKRLQLQYSTEVV